MYYMNKEILVPLLLLNSSVVELGFPKELEVLEAPS